MRLLHEGVHSERPPHDRLADPFPADHAAGSALWNGLPEAAFTMPGTSTACPYLEQFFTAPVSQTGNTPETASVPAPVYLCGSATSSMDVARALAAHGQLPVWGSVLALSQRSGRGQLGRNWVSPEGNVYAALRLPQSHPFTGTAAAPAVGGLIAEALTHMGFDVHMKWPNDLLRREEQEEGPGWCKVGGILLEERPLPPHRETPAENLLVAGIGLNLVSSPPAALMRAQRAVPAGYSGNYSHWNAVESLGNWLKREQVPGITGIDTRELTKVLREHGVMMGKIVFDDDPDNVPQAAYAGVNYVDKVSCREVIRYNTGEGRKKVLLVDCGVKANIIRCLLKRDVEVIRVPWDYDFNGLEFDGLFISNGPGDPDTCDAAVRNIRKAMQNEKLPIFGICMGNQLLSKAGGAEIYKLKYGHRSHNQPVRMVGTERCFITSQNHGYAVDSNTLGADWEPLFVNMNDGSNEGIRHKRNPWFSAQFHPEAASGPTDTEFLFDEFVKLL